MNVARRRDPGQQRTPGWRRGANSKCKRGNMRKKPIIALLDPIPLKLRICDTPHVTNLSFYCASRSLSLNPLTDFLQLSMPLPYPLLNRELGILGFNDRVLSQAADTAVPLLERL